MDQISCESSVPVKNNILIASTLVFVMCASAAFALTVPTAGLGFAFYTVINTLYTSGIGYVVAFIMFGWGCIDLVKNWKEGLAWAAGGLGVASIPALVNAAGLVL